MGFTVLDSEGKIKTSIVAVDAGDITSGTLANDRFAAWTNVAFNAADYTTDNATAWTVQSADIITFNYFRVGPIVFIQFEAELTVLAAGGPTYLKVALPFTIAGQGGQLIRRTLDGDGTLVTAQVVGVATEAFFRIYKTDVSTWTAGSSLEVRGQFWFQV